MTATVDSSSVQDIQKKVRGVLRPALDCVIIIGHRRSGLDTGIQSLLAFVANRKEEVSTPYALPFKAYGFYARISNHVRADIAW